MSTETTITPKEAKDNLDIALKLAHDTDPSGEIIYGTIIPKWKKDALPPPANLSIAGVSPEQIEALRGPINSILKESGNG
jgi:hypothetical protein